MPTYRMHILVLRARTLQVPVGRLVGGQTTQPTHQQRLGRVAVALIVAQCVAQLQVLVAGYTTLHVLRKNVIQQMSYMDRLN